MGRMGKRNFNQNIIYKKIYFQPKKKSWEVPKEKHLKLFWHLQDRVHMVHVSSHTHASIHICTDAQSQVTLEPETNDLGLSSYFPDFQM